MDMFVDLVLDNMKCVGVELLGVKVFDGVIGLVLIGVDLVGEN